ncbi:MAG: GNAT family N-acetyltransferase [Candidatus Pelethousia sp.]|nr:GNAT family N-acetyltransferase [Candidatus Pelethousia sp.]
MLRMATMADRETLKALWQLCFQEEPAFLDWFFNNRFLPDYCPVWEEDGKIAAALHSLPVYISLRDVILPCAIVAGVATHPDCRGRGLMHQLFAFFMGRLQNDGVPLIAHRPVNLEIYHSVGHFPACDSRYIDLSPTMPRPATDDCVQWAIARHEVALYRCYACFAKRYSGMVQRSYADFVLKCRDYLSSGAKCIAALDKAGNVEGYCIYFDNAYEKDNTLLGEECVALSPSAYERLYTALARRSIGRPLNLRLAPDAGLTPPGARVSVLPRGVLGVTDVAALLSAMGLPNEGAIEVIDPLLPANRGVFSLAGKPTSARPQLRISAGRLAQWAVGYRSMGQIVKMMQAAAPDPSIVARMDKLGTRPCFMIDEY